MKNSMFPGTYATPAYLDGGTKRCCTCGEDKPLMEFALANPSRATPHRRKHCRSCVSAHRKALKKSAAAPKIGVSFNDGL